jgi:uncharacterized protein (TIGR02466 family)
MTLEDPEMIEPLPGAAATAAPPVQTRRYDFAPNCIWTFTVPGHEALNPRLLALIDEERRLSPAGRDCAGRDMWQSSRSVADEPPVRELFRSIFGVAAEVADFLRWDVRGRQPVCEVCWANVHPPGSYHTRHIHPATVQLSGVYYIQAPKGCGDIVFHDLARFLGLWAAAPAIAEPTLHNLSRFAVEPQPGLCVLFPAYVMHEVETNRSDGERVGIAFNVNFE